MIIKKLLTFDDCNVLHGPAMSGEKLSTRSDAFPLQKLFRIRDVTRSSPNDVLLAILSGSLRDYMRRRGVNNPYDVTATLLVSLQECQVTQTIQPEMTSDSRFNNPADGNLPKPASASGNGSGRPDPDPDELQGGATRTDSEVSVRQPPQLPTDRKIGMKTKLSMVSLSLPTNTEGIVPQLWEIKQRMGEVSCRGALKTSQFV